MRLSRVEGLNYEIRIPIENKGYALRMRSQDGV